MEAFHLKLKIGQHEFDSTGEPEIVKEQFAIWRELIGNTQASVPAMASPPPNGLPPAPPIPPAAALADAGRLDRLFHQDSRVVSLTVLPNGEHREADALLLIMLGQKELKGTDQVTGQTLNDGMKQSGLSVERVDRSWGPHLGMNVIRTGVRRGVKYRLTHPGLARAKEIAATLLAMVP